MSLEQLGLLAVIVVIVGVLPRLILEVAWARQRRKPLSGTRKEKVRQLLVHQQKPWLVAAVIGGVVAIAAFLLHRA
jgi:hypothetical protein